MYVTRSRYCRYCNRRHLSEAVRRDCETAALVKIIRYFESELDRVRLRLVLNKRKTETLRVVIENIKIAMKASTPK